MFGESSHTHTPLHTGCLQWFCVLVLSLELRLCVPSLNSFLDPGPLAPSEDMETVLNRVVPEVGAHPLSHEVHVDISCPPHTPAMSTCRASVALCVQLGESHSGCEVPARLRGQG